MKKILKKSDIFLELLNVHPQNILNSILLDTAWGEDSVLTGEV